MERALATFTVFAVKDWSDADKALRCIAEIQMQKDDVNNALNKKIMEAKETAKKQTEDLDEAINDLERKIKAFAKKNRADVDGQTMKLNYGRVYWRKSRTLNFHNQKNPDIVAKIRYANLDEKIFIRTEESPNKEALETLTQDKLEALGVTWKETETLKVEADVQKLAVLAR